MYGHRAFSFLVDGNYDVNDRAPLRFSAELDTLLYNIAGKLMPREIDQLCGYEGYDLRPIGFSPVLDNMLCDIIAELIDDKGCCTSMQLLKDSSLGGLLTVLKHPLNDSTSV